MKFKQGVRVLGFLPTNSINQKILPVNGIYFFIRCSENVLNNPQTIFKTY